LRCCARACPIAWHRHHAIPLDRQFEKRLGAGRACDVPGQEIDLSPASRLSNSTLQLGANPLSVSQDEVSQRIARLALSLQTLLIGEQQRIPARPARASVRTTHSGTLFTSIVAGAARWLILRTCLAVSAQTPEERRRFSTLERLLGMRPSQDGLRRAFLDGPLMRCARNLRENGRPLSGLRSHTTSTHLQKAIAFAWPQQPIHHHGNPRPWSAVRLYCWAASTTVPVPPFWNAPGEACRSAARTMRPSTIAAAARAASTARTSSGER